MYTINVRTRRSEVSRKFEHVKEAKSFFLEVREKLTDVENTRISLIKDKYEIAWIVFDYKNLQGQNVIRRWADSSFDTRWFR